MVLAAIWDLMVFWGVAITAKLVLQLGLGLGAGGLLALWRNLLLKSCELAVNLAKPGGRLGAFIRGHERGPEVL